MDASAVVEGDLPRVNFALLERHQGRRVLLLGETDPSRVDQSGHKATVKTCDGGDVHVALKYPAAFESKFIEFEGIVQGPNQLKEENQVAVGDAVDVGIYNELARLSNGSVSSHFR